MGWEIGSDGDRNIGYGVPAECDHPDCKAEIDRGLSHVCGTDPRGGEFGCGLYFCTEHLDFKDVRNTRTIQIPGEEEINVQLCERCLNDQPSFDQKPDVKEWITHKLTDESWQQWRDENTEEVERMKESLEAKK